MISFLLRRLVSGIIVITVVTSLVFFLTYGASLDIARNILGPSASNAQVAILNEKLGLNRPLFEQYFDWIANALHGDLGVSYFTSEPIGSAISSRLPVTFSMVIVALLITLVVSLALGITAAARGGVVDRVLQLIGTASYVFPVIVLAIGLVYLFAIVLRWVPAIGFVPITQSPGRWLTSIILPSITLAIGGIAGLAAQIRGSLVDELSLDYIRTLRSRGVSERAILCKHALRNAAGPALTVFSLQFIGIFGASLFIERIFALPGYGAYAMNATVQGDLPALLGVTLVSVVLVVIVNLIVDIAQGWLNPKVRL
ncbi:ABC transporter permease [Streptomyces sp. NPDC097727]|uniref:ABC transporter permease n=1 Tax=Streptomyces sp. NPDC097727 TaxID=3366092 RepID=UPI00381A04A2